MILRSMTFLAALSILGCLAKGENTSGGVVFNISETSAGVELSIENMSESPVELMLPMVISIDGSVSGVEFKFADKEGAEHGLCSSLQIVSPPEKRLIINGKKELLIEDKGVLKDIYCLSSGLYRMKAVYTSYTRGGGAPFVIESNSIDIRID